MQRKRVENLDDVIAAADRRAPRRSTTVPAPAERLRIGVSSCLLGNRVRYDGDHKRNGYVVNVLARSFQCVPVCPEVAIGLGVPRPPIELVAGPSDIRALGAQDRRLDVSRPLRAYGRRVARELHSLSGYIFKSGSPSCGVWDVKVRGRSRSGATGRGIFADQIMRCLPLLPVVDEVHLADARVRDNFFERVFFYRRWQALHAAKIGRRELLAFHAAHRLVLMAHGAADDRDLQRLISRPRPSVRSLRAYIERCMSALQKPVTRAGHARVLTHVAGRLRRHLTTGQRAQLATVISRYRHGRLPLIAPIRLLDQQLRRFPDPSLVDQTYLRPGRLEQRLRYHA
jgi:uncharacterized protein YbbK (DUF523 family)/uncharacterized protein YbgA (DUF1722 family)